MIPRISIVLPCYNQAHFLPETLNSVFAQTYQDFELILVNDGSTDGTSEVVADYRERHTFIVVEQANQGLPGALNAGFRRARGEYLTWTSADNILLPNMLEVLSTTLDRTPSVGLVYADRNLITHEGVDLGRFDLPDYDPALLLHVNLVHCCFLYRSECMARVGLYDPEFVYGEDWEYWIRISEHYSMKRVPVALYCYRLHEASMTSELVRGTARSMGYREFSRRIRRRAPMRWYIGRLKWWWLRLTNPQHPAIAGRISWLQAAVRAANKTPPSAVSLLISIAMSAKAIDPALQ